MESNSGVLSPIFSRGRKIISLSIGNDNMVRSSKEFASKRRAPNPKKLCTMASGLHMSGFCLSLAPLGSVCVHTKNLNRNNIKKQRGNMQMTTLLQQMMVTTLGGDGDCSP